MDDAAAATAPDARRDRQRARERRRVFSVTLSGVASGMAALVVFGSSIVSVMTERVSGVNAAVQSGTEVDRRIVDRLGQLQIEVAALRKAQASIAQLPPGAKTTVPLEELNAKIDAVARRQDRLEQAIQSTPEKALSMPLMRRDIDNMRENNAQSIAAIKASVDQVYDLTKWLLGALAIGVFSLAIANFLQRKSDA